MDNFVFTMTTGPGLSQASNRMLEGVHTLEKSCHLGVKGVQLQLLLSFNQSRCVAPNVVSHGSQIDRVLAVKSVGAYAADVSSIRLVCDLAIVLLESTTLAAGRFLLGVRIRRC
jgi:hypothetical protein